MRSHHDQAVNRCGLRSAGGLSCRSAVGADDAAGRALDDVDQGCGRALVAQRLLVRFGQPARLSRAVVANARWHADRRQLHGLPGQDSELRIPASRRAAGRRLLRRAAFGTERGRLQAGLDHYRRQGHDLHVLQSRARLSAADHLPARDRGLAVRAVEGKLNGEEKKIIYPMRRVGCESGEFIRK